MDADEEYLLIKSGGQIMFILRSVWEQEEFQKLIGGKVVGRGLTMQEAIVMKQLMESAK